MNLRDLVGRMAIRTDKVREVMPWEMERAFRLDLKHRYRSKGGTV